jgi:hypothetical protein
MPHYVRREVQAPGDPGLGAIVTTRTLRLMAAVMNGILLFVSVIVIFRSESSNPALEIVYLVLLLIVPVISIFVLLWPEQRKKHDPISD